MQINSLAHTDVNVSSAEQRAVSRSAATERDANRVPDSDRAAGLTRALDAVPDVRPEAVTQGRELYQEVPYPPTEIVKGISRLIARFWDGA